MVIINLLRIVVSILSWRRVEGRSLSVADRSSSHIPDLRPGLGGRGQLALHRDGDHVRVEVEVILASLLLPGPRRLVLHPHGLRQHRHDPRLQVPQQLGVDVDGGRGVLLIDTNLLVAPRRFF